MWRHSFLDMGEVNEWKGFETQEADALLRHFTDTLSLQKFAGNQKYTLESKQKQLMYRARLLQEQLNTYKNAKYFIIGS